MVRKEYSNREDDKIKEIGWWGDGKLELEVY